MNFPYNLDDYKQLVCLTENELREQCVRQETIDRVMRLRAIHAHWMKFPNKFGNDIVEWAMEFFKIGRSQAYEDKRLVENIIGEIDKTSKEFIRWKINNDLEYDLKAARMAGDWRAVSAIEKNRILNNRTDKEDEIELEYEKIVPQTFEPTDDPTVLGIKKVPNLREKIKKLTAKYNTDLQWETEQETEFEEVKDGREA